jgi:hypothetical protein
MGKYFPVFQKKVVLASLGSHSPTVYPEDEGSMIHQNTGELLAQKHNINILEDKNLQYLSPTYKHT